MSHIFGSYEPFGSLKSTFFPGFIAQYFLTFFIEHPVLKENILLIISKEWQFHTSRTQPTYKADSYLLRELSVDKKIAHINIHAFPPENILSE